MTAPEVVPPGLIADALDAHARTLEWECHDTGGPAGQVATDLRRIAADIRAAAPPVPGERVSWPHIEDHLRAGTVADVDGDSIGVLPDDDPRSLIYLARRYLTKLGFTEGKRNHGI